MAPWCGSRFRTEWRIQPSVLEGLPNSSKRSQSGSHHSGRTLWWCRLLADGRSVGHYHELQCIHGAGYLVLNRNGKAQRWEKRRSSWQHTGICWCNGISYVKISVSVTYGIHEWAVQSWPFPFSDKNKSDSRTYRKPWTRSCQPKH